MPNIFGPTTDNITSFRLSRAGSINYLSSHYFHQMVSTLRWDPNSLLALEILKPKISKDVAFACNFRINDENQEKINDDTVLVVMVMYFVTVKSPK